MIAKAAVAVVVAGLVVLAAASVRADVFNLGGTRDPVTGQWSGAGSLEFVMVGDPGNAADTRTALDGVSHFGAVGYTYQMGRYDVTSSQYAAFLNAVAVVDPYGLYGPMMAPVGPGTAYCGILRSGNPGSYSYSVMPGRENFPVTDLTWGAAARFCNWLANGQPGGPEGPGTTETGSYTLNGATTLETLANVCRNPWATYVLPNNDEWYKAAYYKGGSTSAGYWLYPTRSDQIPSNVLSASGTNNANYAIWYHYAPYLYTDPVNYLTAVGAFAGSPGPYGTFDMGGNASQLIEGIDNNGGSGFRGNAGGSFVEQYYNLWGSFNPRYGDPGSAGVSAGFRVSLVPEPTAVVLLALAGAGVLCRRKSGGR